MSNTVKTAHCFIPFQQSTAGIALPERFTFPFYYEPHPLCLMAAEQLQNHLQEQTEWEHDFGLAGEETVNSIGKMFGVLVVQNQAGELGYLAAFSGKLADSNDHQGFVPPVFDMLQRDGFFKQGEVILNAMNRELEVLEQQPAYLAAKAKMEELTAESEQQLADYRKAMKVAKKARKAKREAAREELVPTAFAEYNEELRQESLRYNFTYKDLVKDWKQRLTEQQAELDKYALPIAQLKQDRKQRSAALQKQLFDQYQFLNQAKATKSVLDIFAKTVYVKPPAGAGECAAPKLLQYAFKHDLRPVAMAEFWWGQSPKSAIRKHGQFYPACRGKCEPILAHMLAGIDMDKNPLLTNPAVGQLLTIVYEDEEMLVINKPSGFLSVPGIHIQDSVYLRVKQRYPQATGPLIVHRLDMSTSGLMVLAKNKAAHKALQQQFIKRTISKRYVALLDGELAEDSGIIDLPLILDFDDRPRQMVCYERGKAATTKWEVIERSNRKTRVHFYPITGRTHQLRMHAAHSLGLNTPIVGDDLYGKKADRLHLHAEWIRFQHPVTGEVMEIRVEAGF
ncbi:MAG: RluA family pseudouridine synthase [Saprospiraceae bacterium]